MATSVPNYFASTTPTPASAPEPQAAPTAPAVPNYFASTPDTTPQPPSAPNYFKAQDINNEVGLSNAE
jgi:hypothetical protein